MPVQECRNRPNGPVLLPYGGLMVVDGYFLNNRLKCLYGADTVDILAVLLRMDIWLSVPIISGVLWWELPFRGICTMHIYYMD